MNREPRGFDFALDPVQRKCDWEIQTLEQALAGLSADIAHASEQTKLCEQRLQSARADLASQAEATGAIHIDRQVLARSYIATLDGQARQANASLFRLESERERVRAVFFRLKGFADGLAKQREQEVKDYALKIASAEMVVADDAWLKSTHWRNAQ